MPSRAPAGPSGFPFGTILLAIKRSRFAVLAADRIYGSGTEETPAGKGCLVSLFQGPATAAARKGVHTKIVLHRTLPLALASTGLAELPERGRRIPTSRYLREIAAEVQDSSFLRESFVVPRLIERIEPLVRTVRQTVSDPRKGTKFKVVIAVILARESGIVLNTLGMADTTEWVDGRHYLGHPGGPFDAFYSTGRYAREADLFEGPEPDNPAALTAHARRVIMDGIEFEASLYDGQNREVGGGVDVALVDFNGARFVEGSAGLGDTTARPNSDGG